MIHANFVMSAAPTAIMVRAPGDRTLEGRTLALNGRTGVLATLNVHVNASGLVETDTTAQLLLLLDITQTGRQVGVLIGRTGAVEYVIVGDERGLLIPELADFLRSRDLGRRVP